MFILLLLLPLVEDAPVVVVASLCEGEGDGPGLGSTQPINSMSSKHATAKKADQLRTRSPRTLAAAFLAFLFSIL